MKRQSEKYDIDPFTGEIRLIMDEVGHEVPDPNPMSVPLGMKKPETLAETVRRLVRSERFNQEREEAGEETFDEADDFDVEDFDPTTPYEVFFDPVLNREVSPVEFERNKAGYMKRYEKAHERFEQQVGQGSLEENILRAKHRSKPKGEGAGEASPAKGEAEAPKPA